MPIVMTRIDDRLLHGQVSLGWGPTLRPDLVIVADDSAAADPWEREVYEASGPDGVEVRVLDVEGAAREFAAWASAAGRVLVLVRDPGVITRLLDAGCPVGAVVNVGGLHAAGERVERGGGYFLSDTDVRQIRDIESRGVRCEFQPLPADAPRDLARVLGGGNCS